MIVIKKTHTSYYSDINAYLRKNQNSTPFHTPQWAKILFDTYNHSDETLVAFDNEKICGLLQLSLLKAPFSRGLLASGVFASHCEVLADNEKIKNDLLEHAINLSHDKDVNYLEIKGMQRNDEKYSKFKSNNDFCTMRINCEQSIDEIWRNLSKNVRYDIRRSEKEEFEFDSGNKYFDDFYNLVSIMMKQHGTPVHKKEFYKNILDKIENSYLLVCKYHNNIIAAKLMIGLNNVVHSLVGVSDSAYWKLRPNEFLSWQAIKFIKENNYKILGLGRSKYNSGTFEFKRKLGAEPTPLSYLYYSPNGKSIPNIYQDNEKLQFLTKIWSKLPLAFTRELGHYFIRYIP